jgi:hypothetical protein
MDLHDAMERLRQFSFSWNDDDVIDDASGLTGADVKLVVQILGEQDIIPPGVAD